MVELVMMLAQSFTFVAPVSLTVKLAQALSFVTLDHVLLPILSHDQQDRDHRVLSNPPVRHVLLHNRRVCLLADLLHHVLHDLRGPGVLLVARLTGCLLPHHVPDVSVLSTGFVSSLKVCKLEFLFGLMEVKRKKVLTKLIFCLDSVALFSSSG